MRPRSADGVVAQHRRQAHIAVHDTASHAIAPLPPEAAHLLLVVVHRRALARHALGDVVPADLAQVLVAALAVLQRLLVVRRGEPARPQELEEVEQAQLAQVVVLVARAQRPGAHRHLVRRRRHEGADGDRHDVVDHQVGEDQHVAAELRHARAALLAEALDQALAQARPSPGACPRPSTAPSARSAGPTARRTRSRHGRCRGRACRSP